MVSPQEEKSRSDWALEHLLAMHNAVSFVNDLSVEELLIITKSVVHYQLVTSAVRRTKI